MCFRRSRASVAAFESGLEQGIGDLARIRVLVQHPLERGQRLGILLLDIVGLAEPVLGVVGEAAVRVVGDHVDEGLLGPGVVAALELVEGGGIGLAIAARCCGDRRGRGRDARLEFAGAAVEVRIEVADLRFERVARLLHLGHGRCEAPEVPRELQNGDEVADLGGDSDWPCAVPGAVGKVLDDQLLRELCDRFVAEIGLQTRQVGGLGPPPLFAGGDLADVTVDKVAQAAGRRRGARRSYTVDVGLGLERPLLGEALAGEGAARGATILANESPPTAVSVED